MREVKPGDCFLLDKEAVLEHAKETARKRQYEAFLDDSRFRLGEFRFRWDEQDNNKIVKPLSEIQYVVVKTVREDGNIDLIAYKDDMDLYSMYDSPATWMTQFIGVKVEYTGEYREANRNWCELDHFIDSAVKIQKKYPSFEVDLMRLREIMNTQTIIMEELEAGEVIDYDKT